MDLNPGGTTPKRPRSKPKTDTAAAPTSRAPAKRVSKAKTADSQVIEVTSITAIAMPSDMELAGMIATAAYYLAEQRNFEPGHELEDWLIAEHQIRTLHT